MNETLIWQVLEKITDPEIPVVSLIEMGIVREVGVEDGHADITITPTFSACPALHEMKTNIIEEIRKLGFESVSVIVVYSPPWSTDWIKPSAREKLKEIGLMPPKIHTGNISQILFEPVPCPYCDSEQTSLKNNFGTTPCRMIYFCNNCIQPFEYFKPL